MNKNTKTAGTLKRFGYIPSEGGPITYQIGKGSPLAASMDDDEKEGSADRSESSQLTPINMDAFHVWPNGVNNDDPTVCKNLIKGNRLIPSVLEKQIAILYGSGPKLYIEKVKEDGTPVRQYIQDEEIQAWLESWPEKGLASDYRTYLIECIKSSYYLNGVFSKYRLSKGVRAKLGGFLPVVGLEHISGTRARMATKADISQRRDLTLKDFDWVIIANWEGSNAKQEYLPLHILDRTDPFKYPSPVSYSRNPGFGDAVYSTNTFFQGVKEWIKGCNATPEYINSFLENSLSARHHVIIPNAWIAAKQLYLQNLCEENAERQSSGKELKKIKMGKGSGWTIEVGTEYSDDLLEKYVQLELRKLTNFLSGRGKNQGKTYSSRAFVNQDGKEEKWEINEIKQDYKEYIEALISYDKRSDMVLLAAMGIDPSISNITPDGTVSKSGADAYYNYMIYLTQQSIPEQVVCADINYAIRLNFPEKYAQGVRLGFYRPNVQRQEDITPSQRMSNQSEQQ